MPRFAASLMFLFTEAPFLERFALARQAGFGAVECQNPYAWPADEIRRRLDRENLAMVLVNAPAGDGEKGERGFAALPGREGEFRESLDRGLAYARALACPCLHVLAGNALAARESARQYSVGGGDSPAAGDREEMERTYIANLRHAAAKGADAGVRVLIEPLNPVDAPGYFLGTMAEARRIADKVGHPNLWLQYDVYHAGISGEPLADTFRQNAPRIAHIQIAGAPGRHEPMPSDIAYADLFKLFDDSGYDGWIGCEYRPRAGTMAGLAWAAPWGIGIGATL